ncbi:MAG TPA: LysR family transcriptional regulator [Candidatus Gallimonas gallistercoris]|uniref:LysR family transcriptional regulator n=1 Tax=Candidatus Gallimonas gallistercoris TaxID=2838602 RepID=A0A9D2KEP4_9FIRM|nr:LysR family transcriptional regulator [Candidatus Gallimonas gallistercoris]
MKTFCAVCEAGGITRAAEKLCVAQPSVSQTIGELERYYGVSLFDRVGRRLVLTPEGERLRVKAQEAIASFSEFEEAARDTKARHIIRIGSSVTAGQMVLPRLITAIETTLDRAECRAIADSAAAVEQLVEEGSLDFALVEGSVSRALAAEAVFSDRLLAVCSAGMKIKNTLSPSELVSLPLLLRRRGSASRDLLDERLSALGLKAQPKLSSSSNSVLLAAAREGLGVAVLPEALVAAELAAGRLKEVRIQGPELSRRWFAVRRQDKKFTPAQQQAFELLFSLSLGEN